MATTTSGSETATSIFVTGLRNQHSVEAQAIQLLNRQIERIENYPEMLARMRQHVTESEEQQRRLEELLDQLGESHSSLKDAALGFMGNMAAIAHTVAPDEIIKNSFANFAFEHFEIASYKALLILAEATGHGGAQQLLTQSLREEQNMAQWIDDNLKSTTLRFLQRSERGERAGL
ncbi:MAG: ferritin-like domain-containing protein [Acidisphaera sp.]|nr:ferritin-like domain-containing protein [Acidisphaera sp.]MBV9812407.1 ferritin-like domain-containing protein [Acetobacteraceae bacterium]